MVRAAGVAAMALLLSGCILTPHPLSEAELAAQAAVDREAMFAEQEPLTRPLTLREAFRRALAYNLDARVKVVEEALAHNDLDLSRYDLLPKLAANGAFLWRNNVNAASSEAVATGQQSLVPSTSEDRNRWVADLTLSWNLIDFGVSYFNARQQANHILVVDEERRKVVDTMLQDVRRAYWRAAAAQVLHGRIMAAIRASQDALPAARKVESEGLRSPIDSLRYQKALLDLTRQLESVQHLLDVSKVELASLIDLPPGERYSLAVPGTLRMRSIPMPIADMEETALIYNPDIRQQSYLGRISRDEVRKALVRLLPGVNLTVAPNFDSNSFLVNNEWVAASARLGGYLNNLLIAPVTIRRAHEVADLAAVRREAVSISVLAKLHIAVEQYLAAAADFRRSSEVAEVDERLYQQISNRTESDVQGDLERVSAQVSAVFSELRRYESYAEAQAALGRIYATLGLDPAPDAIEVLDLAGVKREIIRVKAENANTPAPPPQADAAPAPSVVAQTRDERLPLDPPRLSWSLPSAAPASPGAAPADAPAASTPNEPGTSGSAPTTVVDASDPHEASK